METDGFPGFQQFVPQGLQYLQYLGGQPRVPDTADTSYSFVKYSIARLGLRRQARIGREFDKQGGTIAPDTIPNVFELLRKHTRYLLPHLRFEQLNISNEQDYKIFFPSLSVVFGYKQSLRCCLRHRAKERLLQKSLRRGDNVGLKPYKRGP